jgi:glycosyltransferase involved in cell wall biosynthesis
MNKINLLFDCKIFIDAFLDAGSIRSGIFFVAWNVLQTMHKNENLQIMLAYPSEYAKSKGLRELKMQPFFSQFKFVCVGFGPAEIYILSKINMHKKNKNYAKMFYNYLRLAKLKIKDKIYYREENFKNVHIYLSIFYSIPQKILKQKHIKKFYILYDVTPLILRNLFDSYGIKPYILLKEALDKDVYAFCISQSCKEDYLKYHGDKLNADKMFVTYISTNQNYIPNYNKQDLASILKKYKVEHNLKDSYLFSLCSLVPHKNLPFTIACFFKFIKKHSIQNFYFYLGGSAWKNFESVMAKTLEEAGEYRHKIKLLGYIDDCDLNILYSNSLFFTFLSQYEGFGMPPLEAMQAGTPVIVSNNSSLPEVVGDAAISVTYNDEPAVIKAFEDFYFNEELRKEYIAKGLERAKMFSWEKTVSRMVSIIEEVVKCSA